MKAYVHERMRERDVTMRSRWSLNRLVMGASRAKSERDIWSWKEIETRSTTTTTKIECQQRSDMKDDE